MTSTTAILPSFSTGTYGPRGVPYAHFSENKNSGLVYKRFYIIFWCHPIMDICSTSIVLKDNSKVFFRGYPLIKQSTSLLSWPGSRDDHNLRSTLTHRQWLTVCLKNQGFAKNMIGTLLARRTEKRYVDRHISPLSLKI